jgi:hypothetical protein
LAQVVLVEGWEAEPARAEVEPARVEAEPARVEVGTQAGLALGVAEQERAAAVRAKVGPVAEDRAVEDPVELEEVVASAVLAV